MSHLQSATHISSGATAHKERQIGEAAVEQLVGYEIERDDAVYFSRRARQELAAAIHASSGKARRAHLQLAEAYECRAHLLTAQLRRDADYRIW